MNIYFAGSIRGATFEGKEAAYAAIIQAIRNSGHDLISEHGAVTGKLDKRADWFIHRRDCEWIHDSDVLIAEVSAPSLGVGYEVSYAESMGLEVLCLYREGVTVSAMILGSPELTAVSYGSPEAIEQIVTEYLLEVQNRIIEQ